MTWGVGDFLRSVIVGVHQLGYSGKNITFSPGTRIDPKIKVLLQTPGAVTLG
jgi:hypothetical protein